MNSTQEQLVNWTLYNIELINIVYLFEKLQLVMESQSIVNKPSREQWKWCCRMTGNRINITCRYEWSYLQIMLIVSAVSSTYSRALTSIYTLHAI